MRPNLEPEQPADAAQDSALAASSRPRYVIPNHHDDMTTPLGETVVAPAVIEGFRATVARVSPGSTVIEPRHLEPVTL